VSARVLRIGAGVALIVLVQSAVCALAALPVALAWQALLAAVPGPLARAVLVASMALPTYAGFALVLVVVSPLLTRLVVPPAPAGAEMRIADARWPLLCWCHRAVATHLVRLLAGWLFRGSPLWTCYLRLAGARVGRRVYVNSVALADPHLLEIGDDVVIGADAHLSGHTVERGVVKTGSVRVGAGATIGLGSVVDIGADIGAGCVVGALSLVPKFATLSAGAVYAGIPVRELPADAHGSSPASIAGPDGSTRTVSRRRRTRP
jgi:serine acetyltransferase